MQVSVSQLKIEYNRLSRLLEEYENNYLNIYNVMNDAFSSWQDGHAALFEQKVNADKVKRQIFGQEIGNVISVYKVIIDSYSCLGRQIKFDLRYKDKTLSKLSTYIADLDTIIKLYGNLRLSFCPREAKYINNQKKIWQDNRRLAKEVETSLQKWFNYIADVEKKVNKMIKEINITALKHEEIDKYVGEL